MENWKKLNPNDVKIGEIIVIKPGEKSSIRWLCSRRKNQVLIPKALTGESLPREVTEGEEVLSGCINLNGVIKVEVTKRIWRINSK